MDSQSTIKVDALINDGTCSWDESLPLIPALRKRADVGHGYNSLDLERKRLDAIEWLRKQSKMGWALDKIKEKV